MGTEHQGLEGGVLTCVEQSGKASLRRWHCSRGLEEVRGGGSRQKSISDRCQDELTLGLGHVLSGRGGGGGQGQPEKRLLRGIWIPSKV